MTKNYVIGGLLVLVAALLFGVEPVQRIANEGVNRGTLKGVENCIAYSSSDLMSQDAVKAACVAAFQKGLYSRDSATGRAGPREIEDRYGWGGVLENKTSDRVTTWVSVSVFFYDAEGTEKAFTADTPVWIDPLSKAEFLVDLPEIEGELHEGMEYCDHDKPAPKDCMSWAVVDIKGLTV